ncbi:MAG: RdgB/HAM1 family non-canonical purine NTP pyrophosphatase [Simkaniaceae bacterium]|nr:RdgB/HAM1 family non-canonical purine NTP pyrophosphatase [Chlamydiia bacterium]
MQIVIASSNLHKIREIRSILKPRLPFDYLSLLDFPSYQPPEETGSTFEENAFIKATHAASALKRWVIADDSGLVVPALKDRPGVHSRRFAGEHASDKENRQKLVQELDPISESERIGYYTCALALASPEGIQKQVQGLCEGSLILAPRGSQGFGYDPLFLKYDYNKTFAEMDEETKNKISHRRKALDKLFPFLEELLRTG